MADHAVSVELFYSGDWHARGAYTRDGITLSRGAPGEGQDAPPSTAGLTLDNFDGELSPDNASSPLYGLVGRNTPVRVVADGSTRSTTELGKLGLDRTLDADGVQGDAWATVQGGGILRRLQQGTTPLLGPLHRAILADAPAAFWPMTELAGGTQFSSGLSNGPAMPLTGTPKLADVAGPAGALGSVFPDFSDGLGGGGPVAVPDLGSSAWGFEALIYVAIDDETISGSASLARWKCNGDIGRDGWSVNVGYDPDPGAGGYSISVTGNGFADSVGFGVGAFEITRGWHHIRLQQETVGPNVVTTIWCDGEIPTVFGLGTDTNAGVLGSPKPIVVGSDILQEIDDTPTAGTAALGMLAFYSGTVPDHSYAATGYAGELAGVRFLRLLGEEGITAIVVGDENDTQPMGPQPPDTIVNLARECVRTDDGMMFEPRDDRALVMRTGRSRYNQDAAAVFDFAAGVFAPGLVPIYDDQNTRNYVVVERRNGGKETAFKLAGPLNMNDPIDDPEGVGKFDTRVEVNTETDEVLYSRATWEVSKGTVAEPRYAVITIDLDASPSLIATVDALDIGDRFEIENLPADWSLAPASLLLLGVKEKYPPNGGDFRRLVMLNAAPAAPYEVLLVGNSAGSIDLRGMRAGTERSTVDGAHTNSDTTILIDSDGIAWTTDADNWDVTKNGGGMFLMIAGELVRVTGIAGAGSAWTLSVVRSVNGVVKAIADGTPVRFAYPGRLGL